MENLIQALIVSAEICGFSMSAPAARVMVAELSTYGPDVVEGALRQLCRTHKGRFTLHDVLQQVGAQDGRPGAEEAWATMPKRESESAVLTQEQLTAWAVVCDLFDADPIGARMAFKEAYSRLVQEARGRRQPVAWQLSMGIEQSGRMAALLQAVQLERIPPEFALQHCPPDHVEQMQAALGRVDQAALSAPKRDVGGMLKKILSGKVEALDPCVNR